MSAGVIGLCVKGVELSGPAVHYVKLVPESLHPESGGNEYS